LQDAEILRDLGYEGHAKVILGLTEAFPNTIRLRSLGGDFNCFQYALGLLNSPVYKRIAITYPKIFTGTEFISFLLENNKLKEVDHSYTPIGVIVLYFNGGRPQHAGILEAGKVVSKWEAHGSLWEHDLFAVPASYGSQVKYFLKPPEQESLELFIEWARSKGIDESLLSS